MHGGEVTQNGHDLVRRLRDGQSRGVDFFQRVNQTLVVHDDQRLAECCGESRIERGVPLLVFVAETDDDDVGVNILGAEDRQFWKDHKGGKINAIRTRTMIDRADIVVVRFGDRYKQWNAAFDAGFAAALGKPLIIMHDESLIHPLKEVDAAALAVTETPDQVVAILRYLTTMQ